MKRSQETLSCELGDTHLTDPPPSSSPSPNGAGIKGGRPPRKPKSSFERKCSTVRSQLHGSRFQTLVG
ncbi:hypothetical protein IC582_026224 [Cucumis melo]|uniref:Uncharacterized protein n=1 Tax=Cucumis melo TaxID=3656 RepID=A0A9I9DYI4_CUCME